MSGSRYRLAPMVAAVAAVVLASPALAWSGVPDPIAAGPSGATAPSAPSALTERPEPATIAPQLHELVGHAGGWTGFAPIGWYGRGPWGFHGFWGPYWWGDPWWYGRAFPSHIAALEPAVPKGQVLVALRIDPSRAAVVVDGVDRGKARKLDAVDHPLWLAPGDHVIELRAKGYQTGRLDFHFDGGHAYALTYDLSKGQGLDARSSPPSS